MKFLIADKEMLQLQNGVSGHISIWLQAQFWHWALATFMNDLCWDRDSGSVNLLILLNVPVAFDTVNHGILLDHFSGLGVESIVILFLYAVLLGISAQPHSYGILQGSILSTILLNIYFKPQGE